LIVKTEAIVLKCINYRETSKIVTFYSKSHGKIRGIAKAVRSTKTRWGGVLQSMAYLNLFFYFKENKDLHLVSNAEYANAFKSIYGDYDKLQAGFKIIELVNRTTADHEPNDEVFNLLKFTLENLESATKNYSNLLFYFEFRLCELLGFGIHPGMLNPLMTKILSKLNQGELKSIEFIAGCRHKEEGNFNTLLNLNISVSTTKVLESFFENYLKNHLEHINNSKTGKVFKSQEAHLTE
jgi:Recombination protein O N terminal/Recombination protein O C terminal